MKTLTTSTGFTHALRTATSIAMLVMPSISKAGIAGFPVHSPWLTKDPQFGSWRLNETGAAAQVRLDGTLTPVDTWKAVDTGWNEFPNWLEAWQSYSGQHNQPEIVPQPADVSAIVYTSNHVFVIASGLASYKMGPWFNDVDGDGVFDLFEFRPMDRTTIYRWAGALPYVQIPRKPVEAYPSLYPTGLGAIAIWVNGTSVYGPLDGFCYFEGERSAGTHIWNEDANWKESMTFDIAGFHQDGPGTIKDPAGALVPTRTWGQHHAHINPVALRWQLGDNVLAFTDGAGDNEVTDYREMFLLPRWRRHSPILGWAFDGYPIYGPYGYTDPWNTTGGVTRMRSGYVIRNGLNGTYDLTKHGRNRLPNWAAIVQGRSPDVSASGPGPEVSEIWELGCFLEDYDYRGDLAGGGKWGADWDLDRYNGRRCRTPEYPDGTYAYFVSIDETGKPQFPYVIGPMYKGKVNGGEVETLPASYWTY